MTCSDFNDHGDVIDIKKETIKVKKDDQKRGEKLVVLKTTLQQKITENRNLQLAKRIEEYKLYEEEYYGGKMSSIKYYGFSIVLITGKY